VARYGKAEVESWLWELWNEPNISYWHGTLDEYCKLYDYTVRAVKSALPTARMGGPHSTGPGNEKSAAFLRGFLEHVRKTGVPLDYIGFHAKGSPRVVDGHVVMGMQSQLRDLAGGFAVVASFPEFKNTPIIIGESDPEGCAACSARFHPQNAYRNGVMYSSYTAAVFPKHLDLAAQAGVNLMGAVTWAFEFEDQPYFDGFRDLATNGIAKPVLNVFRMFGLMRGDRLRVESPMAMAARQEREATILVWNYDDSELPAEAAHVTLAVNGVNAERVRLEHFRVDREYSNSYEAWKAMGSPQQVTPTQYKALERASELQSLHSPQWITVRSQGVELPFDLPRHGVSLVRLTW
jgi:xylan 1,4-beta-xylosidase